MITIKTGDLLMCTEDYLGHICNISSSGAKGLAWTIFSEIPESNTYSGQYAEKRTLGCVSNHYNVLNMYAQRFPGTPKKDDTYMMRLKWFKKCLLEISKNKDITSLALPFGIGSGLAGGLLEDYLDIIIKFSDYADWIDISLYKLEK